VSRFPKESNQAKAVVPSTRKLKRSKNRSYDGAVVSEPVPELLTTKATTPSLSNISDAKRALLLKYLQGDAMQTLASPRTITPLASDSPLPVSFAQERLWFLDQLMPGSAVFNVPLAVRLSTSIDVAVLEQSLNEIVRRHEVLRTTFATVNGQPVPVVSPELKVALQVFDLNSHPVVEREAYAKRLSTEQSEQPFDLVNGPLIRASLISLDTEDHVFLVTMHHICSDGWSLVVFFQELAALYEAFAQGDQSPLPTLPIQYADYAAWQKEWLQADVLERQLGYWKEKLSGELPILDLPTDRPRPAVQTYAGARASLLLSTELTEGVKRLSQREGATMFMTLLTTFKVLLCRYCGQDDIVVGSPIANRPQTETEGLIGFFLNNLALRTKLEGNPTFQEALARVRQTALAAYAHQDVPFEKLIEELRPERDLSRTTIFQVYFNLFNFAAEIKVPGSSAPGTSFFDAWSQSEENLSKFDLTLYAGVHDGQIRLALVYNTDLFDETSITRMLAHFRALLKGVVANPQLPISDYSTLTDADRREIGNDMGPTNLFTRFEKAEIEQSIPDRFASQVRKYSSKTAIKSRNHQWSYEQLNRAANRVARSILNRLPPESRRGEERIALLFEHDAPMIAALLGTLKAGKTYVPLDPSHPRERLTQILNDSEASTVLTNNKSIELARELTREGLRLVNIDSVEWADSDSSRDSNGEADINLATNPRGLAYLLYTSGSTGQPKGVMQNHRNVLHFIRAYTNNLHLSENDRLTLLSSYCFDAAVMDIFGALLNGATLYPIDIKKDGLIGLAEWLSKEQITVYHSTPSVYRYFVNSLNEAQGEDFAQLRLVVLGGEEVNRTDVDLYKKHFSDDCLFVNGLGPTEATVSLQYFIDKQTTIPSQGVPVGYPVADTEVLLLNEAGKSAEVRGEIAIKCEHVALGYWRNAKATDAAFSSEPQNGSQDSAARVYRTGDLGRRLSDGSIVFEGRRDFQIKIRGFRVELGDIESALSQHPAVRENVVILKQNNAQDKRLVAYVVLNSGQAANERDLRDFLKTKLPEYMQPASFGVLEALPLTASGKLNRRALPDVTDCDAPKVISRNPETTVEKLLARIWLDLLGVNELGVNDNFFELGGHSLLAVRLFAQIEKYFGRRLPLATLFQAPTVAQLAEIIQQEWTPRWSSLVPIQTAGSQPPFFCVHALGGNVLEYYDLARHLGADQPFYGFQSQGLDGQQTPHTRIEDMAAHYVKEMRELQPEGPYFIGGRSMGGTIAFEMASQLQAMGEEVGLLALLDTYPSGYANLLLQGATVRTRLARVVKRIKCHGSNLRGLSAHEKVHYIAGKLVFAPAKLKAGVWQRIYRAYESFGQSLPRVLQNVREFNSMATRAYRPQVFRGKVTLFWASGDLRATFDLVEGWRILAGGGIDVHEISGDHLNIIKEPYVGELATKLSKCLERARAHLIPKSEELPRSLSFNQKRNVESQPERMKKAS
jgi:amino acid adenylation domain-containing protein